ncbi:MAG: class I SAM-dependent methyltransferase [Candidatus Bathyarchaeia archaeon]
MVSQLTKEVIAYFDKESHIYETIRWRGDFVSRYDFEVTREALTSLVDKSELFLDMGCDLGTRLEELHRNNKTCIGIDVSLEMLRLCRAKNLPNIVVLADCHKLPFRDYVFDTTIASRVFIYVDFEVALKEVKRVLKNGRFILLVQVERRSIYFKLWNSLRRDKKFLETEWVFEDRDKKLHNPS